MKLLCDEHVPPAVDPEVLRRELHHRHLPKLSAMGFGEWEADPLVAGRGPRNEEVATVIKALRLNALERPDSLGVECQRLEIERHLDRAD
jgi:hypothetical protein